MKKTGNNICIESDTGFNNNNVKIDLSTSFNSNEVAENTLLYNTI